MLDQHYPFTLPPLPCAYNALEPYIDTETMHIHHDIMFKKYVDNLNMILKDNPIYQDWSLHNLLAYSSDFEDLMETALKNNGGGVMNHYMYFDGMTPNKTEPSQNLQTAIIRDFGSMQRLCQVMKTVAISQFGSGYAWLMYDSTSKLRIVKTPNQDPPPLLILQPLLVIDVWEHAYFLQYEQQRDKYFDAWCNVIDWEKVSARYPAG